MMTVTDFNIYDSDNNVEIAFSYEGIYAQFVVDKGTFVNAIKDASLEVE